ncbi:uncharacterized protein LOC125177647 [Hyalella azteca]|uniref:Uncharacterized protein LOC125177647 n=1 Tax=Hyalella azteca TaxID=294128 RepID=A0A979FGM1_HYAAZ|nr:uncharacterized protein LOC125177647 [Hyalella azteca]
MPPRIPSCVPPTNLKSAKTLKDTAFATVLANRLRKTTARSEIFDASFDLYDGEDMFSVKRKRSFSEGNLVDILPPQHPGPISVGEGRISALRSISSKSKIREIIRNRRATLGGKLVRNRRSKFEYKSSRRLLPSRTPAADSDAEEVLEDKAGNGDGLASLVYLRNILKKTHSDSALDALNFHSRLMPLDFLERNDKPAEAPFLPVKAGFGSNENTLYERGKNFSSEQSFHDRNQRTQSGVPNIDSFTAKTPTQDSEIRSSTEPNSLHVAEESNSTKVFVDESRSKNFAITWNGASRSAEGSSSRSGADFSSTLDRKEDLLSAAGRNFVENTSSNQKKVVERNFSVAKLCGEHRAANEQHANTAKKLFSRRTSPSPRGNKLSPPRSSTSVRDLVKKFSSMDSLDLTESNLPPRFSRITKLKLQATQSQEAKCANSEKSYKFRTGLERKSSLKTISYDFEGTKNHLTMKMVKVNQPPFYKTNFKHHSTSELVQEEHHSDVLSSKRPQNCNKSFDIEGSSKKMILNSKVSSFALEKSSDSFNEPKQNGVKSIQEFHRLKPPMKSNSFRRYSSVAPLRRLHMHHEEPLLGEGPKSLDSILNQRLGPESENDASHTGKPKDFTHVKQSSFQKLKESFVGFSCKNSRSKSLKDIAATHDFGTSNLGANDCLLEAPSTRSNWETCVPLKTLKTWTDIARLPMRHSFRRANVAVATENADVPISQVPSTAAPNSSAHEVPISNCLCAEVNPPGVFLVPGVNVKTEWNCEPGYAQASMRRYSFNMDFPPRQSDAQGVSDDHKRSCSSANQESYKGSLISQFLRSRNIAPDSVIGKNTFKGGFFPTKYAGIRKHSWCPNSSYAIYSHSPEMCNFRRHSLSELSPPEIFLHGGDKPKRLTPSSFYPLTLCPHSPSVQDVVQTCTINSLPSVPLHPSLRWSPPADPPYFCTKMCNPSEDPLATYSIRPIMAKKEC